MWIECNPNPCRLEEPDCVVRAIAIATDRDWHTVHRELCEFSGWMCSMPSVNKVWSAYLEAIGFQRFELPEWCPECVTVQAFCRYFPRGTYIIGTGTHAVACLDGNWIDAWDSAQMKPTYFFRKKGRK